MTNIVQLFSQAAEEHHQERRSDSRERRLLALALAAAVAGMLLFGAVCFDIGLRVGAAP